LAKASDVGELTIHSRDPARPRSVPAEASVAAGRWTRGETRLISALSNWRYFSLSVLGVIVVAIMVLDLLWVFRDTHPPFFDYARHLGDSLFYRSTFTLSHPLRPLTAYVVYPPFAYWVTDLFYWPLGTDQWVATLSNIVFLSVLVGATYGIGKTLWSRRVGLLSALFVVTTPLFVTMFKEYMLDAPLSAMIALALYLLIRSEHFADRPYSFLLGVACGVGLLTKWSFVLCFGLPALFSVGAGAAHAVSRRNGERLLNMAGAGVLAFAISGVWYVHNWAEIRVRFTQGSTYAGVVTGQPPVGSLSSVLWYFWNLVNNQLYLIPFLFFVAGVIVIFRKDESAGKNSLLVLTIVGTYVAFALIRNKSFRYTMPMLPAVAVVGTHWLDYLRSKVRDWLSGGLVAYSVLAFLVISFGTSLLPKDISIHLKARPYTSNLFEYAPPESPRVTGITIFAQHGFIIGKPSRDNWYEDEAFKQIGALGGNRSFVFQADDDSIWFNTWDVRYYSFKYHLSWIAIPDEADFLVIRSRGAPQVPGGFAELRRYPLPDGGTLRLYRRS
jgi:hypothetical protein